MTEPSGPRRPTDRTAVTERTASTERTGGGADPDGSDRVGVTVEAQRLTLLAPRGWTVAVADGVVRVGRESGAVAGTEDAVPCPPRATRSCLSVEFTARGCHQMPSVEALDEAIAEREADLCRDLADCAIDRRAGFVTACGARVRALWFRWTDANGVLHRHLSAVMLGPTGDLYLFHGTTRGHGTRAATDLATFEELVRTACVAVTRH